MTTCMSARCIPFMYTTIFTSGWDFHMFGGCWTEHVKSPEKNTSDAVYSVESIQWQMQCTSYRLMLKLHDITMCASGAGTHHNLYIGSMHFAVVYIKSNLQVSLHVHGLHYWCLQICKAFSCLLIWPTRYNNFCVYILTFKSLVKLQAYVRPVKYKQKGKTLITKGKCRRPDCGKCIQWNSSISLKASVSPL